MSALYNLVRAHNTSNSVALQTGIAGCYYCLQCFPVSYITQWVKDTNGPTACCPFCGIDAVLSETALQEIGEVLLNDNSLRLATVHMSLQHCRSEFF